MACKVLVGMQGRIDATRLFNMRLMRLLANAGCVRFMWDRQIICYHSGPLERSDASLSDIRKAIEGHKGTPPQSAPVGYALIGWHVDDGTGIACDVNWCLDPESNRVVQYLNGQIQVTFATTLTGWHGNKALGFLLTLDDVLQTVSMSAPDSLAALHKLLFDGSNMTVTPKHIMTEAFEDVQLGTLPTADDPDRDSILRRMEVTRRGLGMGIYISNAYSHFVPPINLLCAVMAVPQEDALKFLRYSTAHLVAHPRCNTYGGWGVFGLEASASRPKPFTNGTKDMAYHKFSDAANKLRSVTGGVGMLAGGPIQASLQRQHLKAPCSHTAEVVAGGNNANALVACNGVLQEAHIRLGVAPPF